MELPALLTVRQLMVPAPIAVTPDQPVQEVVRAMNDKRVGAILVQRNEEVLGIFTERDMLRNAAEAPPGWRQRPVADWMTPKPHTIDPDASWEQARILMEDLHVRHLPVVEKGRIVGIVSARSLIARTNEYLNRAVEERTRDLREANEALQRRDKDLRLHMTVAGRIQGRLLPERVPILPEIETAAHYEPLDPLGGDYYDFAEPDSRHLGILISDATGHSIPAALVAIMARTAFLTIAPRSTSPSDVLGTMNRQLHGLTGEHFVTAFYGVLDRQTREFTFANAGHPFPLHLPGDPGRAEPLAATGLMLGVMEDSKYDNRRVQLKPGDRLLFFTDGVMDCRSEEKELFGTARIAEFLEGCKDLSAKSIADGLAKRLEVYRGTRPAGDDITIVAAQIR